MPDADLAVADADAAAGAEDAAAVTAAPEADPAAADRPAGPGEVVLAAQGLHVRYRAYDDRGLSLQAMFSGALSNGRRRFRSVHALRGVDLAVHRGEVLGVIGRNGSGKSTLVRALAGLVAADEGVVVGRATPVLLGVHQVLMPDLSCRRNAVLGATALGVSRREALARADEVLAFAELEDFADLPFRALSSGMRARLHYSIATSVRPEVLIVDESLAVGDAEFKEKSNQRVAQMVREDATVVLVAHSMSSLLEVCTRIVWLDAGRVRADGDPERVVAQYRASIEAREKTRTA